MQRSDLSEARARGVNRSSLSRLHRRASVVMCTQSRSRNAPPVPARGSTSPCDAEPAAITRAGSPTKSDIGPSREGAPLERRSSPRHRAAPARDRRVRRNGLSGRCGNMAAATIFAACVIQRMCVTLTECSPHVWCRFEDVIMWTHSSRTPAASGAPSDCQTGGELRGVRRRSRFASVAIVGGGRKRGFRRPRLCQ
jgi:hypothetical protein